VTRRYGYAWAWLCDCEERVALLLASILKSSWQHGSRRESLDRLCASHLGDRHEEDVGTVAFARQIRVPNARGAVC
jgi:hypothetical protein